MIGVASSVCGSSFASDILVRLRNVESVDFPIWISVDSYAIDAPELGAPRMP